MELEPSADSSFQVEFGCPKKRERSNDSNELRLVGKKSRSYFDGFGSSWIRPTADGVAGIGIYFPGPNSSVQACTGSLSSAGGGLWLLGSQAHLKMLT